MAYLLGVFHEVLFAGLGWPEGVDGGWFVVFVEGGDFVGGASFVGFDQVVPGVDAEFAFEAFGSLAPVHVLAA